MAKLKTHKEVSSLAFTGLCGTGVWVGQLKRMWKDVTCKKCLRMKK